MLAEEVTCRLRVSVPTNKNSSLVSLNEYLEMTPELRKIWAAGVIQAVQVQREANKQIRELDFVLSLNGSVDAFDATKAEHDKRASETSIPLHGSEKDLSSPEIHSKIYPSRFRIPSSTISNLDILEQTHRAEDFALGSLLYEIYTSSPPYPELTDTEIQARYGNADFPAGIKDIGEGLPFVLSFWSWEFACELRRRYPEFFAANRSLFFSLDSHPQYAMHADNTPTESNAAETKSSKFVRVAGTHIRAHPYLSALSGVGLTVSAVAVSAPLILAGIGFGAAGPVAGTAAAAWQASIGAAVSSSSLFAWCQGAAMGGAAANGILGAGLAGLGVTAGGLGASLAIGQTREERMEMMKLFGEVCRRATMGGE